jgi:hypothetical protein
MIRSILAGLLASVTLTAAQAQVPRTIYRDGNYFFCPHPNFDPYCRLENDYSWALYGPPWRNLPNGIPPPSRPGPAVLVPLLLDKALRNAMRPRNVPPPPPRYPVAPPPQMSMEQEREFIIRQGEEHCRKYPQDTQVCHPPKN